jgi:hypothetical protein
MDWLDEIEIHYGDVVVKTKLLTWELLLKIVLEDEEVKQVAKELGYKVD